MVQGEPIDPVVWDVWCAVVDYETGARHGFTQRVARLDAWGVVEANARSLQLALAVYRWLLARFAMTAPDRVAGWRQRVLECEGALRFQTMDG